MSDLATCKSEITVVLAESPVSVPHSQASARSRSSSNSDRLDAIRADSTVAWDHCPERNSFE
ncbi:MAG: hypothetical protein O3A00_27565, partial [Planctomycetota bacterium]|nr:hypothetical protein [Planctomycetota bacterium]